MDETRNSNRRSSESEGEFELDVDKVFTRPKDPILLPVVPKTKKEKAQENEKQPDPAAFALEKDQRGAGRLDSKKRAGAEHFTRSFTRATALPDSKEFEKELSGITIDPARLVGTGAPTQPELPPAPRTDSVPISALPARRILSAPSFLRFGLAAVLLVSVAFFLVQRMRQSPATAESSDAASQGQEALQAREALAAYLREPSWEGKLAHILEPERLRGKLREHYEVMHFTEPEWDASLPGRREAVGGDIWYLFAEKGAPATAGAVFRLKATNSGFKINWEALAGSGEMPWTYFCEIRPTQPKRISVEILPGKTYAGIYADETKFQAYELRWRGRGPFLTGYVERTSMAAQRLQKVTTGAMPITLTLQLACDSTADASQVRILDVATDPIR